MEKRKQLVVTTLIVILGLAGLAWDALGDQEVVHVPTASSDDLIHQRALFCPGRPGAFEGSSVLTTWSGSTEAGAVSIGEEGEPAALPGERVRADVLEGPDSVNVVGSGAPVLAAVSMKLTEPFEAAGAAPCSDKAATAWYFPEGTSDVGYDQRLLVYNPFPDEAVVRVTFVTKKGEESKAGLAKVAVPSGESIQIPIKKYVIQKPALASVVTTVRGRVIAWRLVLSKAEGRARGAEFSLGATQASDRLFFPVGKVDEGSDERITILNPADESATVTVTLTTKDGVVPAPKFVEMTIPPHRTRVLDLGDLRGKKDTVVGPLSATIESENGVGVIAEQSLEFGSNGFSGVGAEFGSAVATESWWAGPAGAAGGQDGLVVLNLGSSRARVDVTIHSPNRGPFAPRSLQDVAVPAGRRVQILLPDPEGKGPYVARVDGDQPLVVVRVAQVGNDVAVLGGVPITPSEP